MRVVVVVVVLVMKSNGPARTGDCPGRASGLGIHNGLDGLNAVDNGQNHQNGDYGTDQTFELAHSFDFVLTGRGRFPIR